jgi:putative PIN family toxin of toxin-antitoxin system
MISVVIDTNVLVSGLISPFGNESFVISGVESSLFFPYFTDEILVEYQTVLSRPRFGFEPDVLDGLFRSLQANGRKVSPSSSDIILVDPSDTKFIACALAAKAAYLVTGNRKHFPDDKYGCTSVVSARELLEIVALGDLK